MTYVHLTDIGYGYLWWRFGWFLDHSLTPTKQKPGGVSQRGKKGGCQIRRPAVWEINGYHHLVVA